MLVITQETAGTPGIPSFINNGSIDGFPTISSLTGLLSQSVKNSEARANGHLNVSDTGYGWYTKAEKGGLKAKEGPLFQSMLAGDKKSRPPSSKNKRPSTDEAVEFRITWEEAQDLLRSPPNVSPNIVTIEGFVFEEYEVHFNFSHYMKGLNLKHIKLCIVSLFMELNKGFVVSVIIIMRPNSHCSFAMHI